MWNTLLRYRFFTSNCSKNEFTSFFITSVCSGIEDWEELLSLEVMLMDREWVISCNISGCFYLFIFIWFSILLIILVLSFLKVLYNFFTRKILKQNKICLKSIVAHDCYYICYLTVAGSEMAFMDLFFIKSISFRLEFFWNKN